MEIGSVVSEVAVRQHQAFVRTLRRLGAKVEDVPFVHGAFDSVFMKDNAVLVGASAFLAMPRHAERRAEQEERAAALGALGMNVSVPARTAPPIEGGDVVVLPGVTGAFLGVGFRSHAESVGALGRFLDRDVTAVELVDPRLYHLDMVLSVLADGTALLCREAVTRDSRRAVENHPAIRDVLEVSLEEALGFGVNLVQVGRRSIVSAAVAPATFRALEERGYSIERVDLDQFHRAGGSAACLVARVHRRRSRVRASCQAA